MDRYAGMGKWVDNAKWVDMQSVDIQWKDRLMNTVTASFDTTVREMTEMFQWPKCLSKKMTNVSAQNGQVGHSNCDIIRVARSLEIFSRTFCRFVIILNFTSCLLWIRFRYRGVAHVFKQPCWITMGNEPHLLGT